MTINMKTSHDCTYSCDDYSSFLKDLKINIGVTKFCGVVKIPSSKKAIKYFKKNGHVAQTITDEEYQQKQTLFYDGFINTFYPPKDCAGMYSQIYAFEDIFDEPKVITMCNYYDEDVNISVESISYYIYPEDILIFVLTLSNNSLSLGELQKRNFAIKMVNWYGIDKDYVPKYSNEYFSLFDEIITVKFPDRAIKESEIRKKFHKLFMGNMFYIYQAIQLSDNYDVVTDDELLYELTTVLNFDAIGKMRDHFYGYNPSSEYFDNFKKNNVLRVYNDWSAAVTIDSFCVLMSNRMFDYACNEWVNKDSKNNNRFMLFLNAVLLKNYLVKCNEKFQAEPISTQTRDKFLKFDRIFNLRTVSYNTLPQLVYEKIRRSFEIDEELAMVNQKISQFSDNRNQRNERVLNYILAFVALFSVSSFFADGITWLTQIGILDITEGKGKIIGARLWSLIGFIIVIILFVILIWARKISDKSNK